MLSIKESPDGIIFKAFIQPRSSKNVIAGLHGDALKIRITAPPVNDAANKMCVKFLSKTLRIPKSSIEIISGHTSRTKQILLHHKNAKVSKKRLKQLISLLIIF